MTFYYRCFWEICTERPPSFGDILFIPINKIFEYCRNRELEGEEKELFIYIISALDAEFVSHHRQKSKVGK